VLCYVLAGQINRETAAELGITERTIKAHRGHVMEKLGVQSTAQLFPMVLRVLRESGCKILEDIKELRRETAATKNCDVLHLQSRATSISFRAVPRALSVMCAGPQPTRQGEPRRSPLRKGSPEGHDSGRFNKRARIGF
jgi:hypothetical protein